jgi:hypothetical protein
MKNLFAVLFFSLFVIACNNDNYQLNKPAIILTLDLLSPLNATTDYCNMDFEWSASLNNIPFILTISSNRNFLNYTVFRDTIIDTTFTLMQNLQPNKMYYWKVQADTVSKMDSFMVQNVAYLGDFIGIFPATATYRHEAYPNDSTWITNVTISFNNDEIPQMTEVGTNLTVNPEEHTSYFDCDVFYYRNKFDFINQPINTLLLSNDTGNLNISDKNNRIFTFQKRIESNHFDIYIEYTGSID